MFNLNKKIYTFHKRYVLAHFEKISVKPGNALWNHQCHRNAINVAKKNRLSHVALVYAVDNLDVILHVVNVDKKGNYTDNTLGHEVEEYDYYLIKKIPAIFNSVFDEFNSAHAFITRLTPWYWRWSKHNKV